MNIVEKNPADLVFYENNPRDNDDAVPFIANSIERFGFKVPVMIDKSNVIICGHTRVKAALNLGLETVPCIVEEEMSEEDIRAFRIVENKTHEFSFWDSSLLRQEMDELDEIEWDDFGFDAVQEFSDEDMKSFFKEVGPNTPSQLTGANPAESSTEASGESDRRMVQCTLCGGWFAL